MDGDLTITSARVTPVLPWAEILDGGGIGTRVNSVSPCPVVSAQIVILHRERRLGAVDGWRGKRVNINILLQLSKECELTYTSRHDMATMQRNRPPSGVFGTFHLGIRTSPSQHLLVCTWNSSWVSGIGSGCSL